MTSCWKEFCKVLTIILTLIDVAVGWFKFSQMYKEISEYNDHNSTLLGSVQFSSCENPNLYWYLYVVFESIGTILAVVEIIFIGQEIKQDNKLRQECFGRTFILIVLIYLTSAFPSAILEIIYRDMCVCNGTFSLAAWRRDVRDFAKGFVGGASVILFQILLHLTEIYSRLRRLGRMIALMCWCCNYIPEDEEPEQKCCEGVMMCFLISLILAFSYVVIFITETLYIFCEPH